MQKNKAVSARELKRLRSAADKSHAKEKGYKRFSNLEFAMSILLVIIIVLSARLLIAEPTRVDGESMYPTLYDKSHMFVEKLTYMSHPPERGDIVICYYPGYVQSCVKRVIALPGETVYVENGRVHVNGEPLDESAYFNGVIKRKMQPVLVPEGHVFVMGDNRNNSKDSRDSTVGPIPYERIVGRVVDVIWPLSHACSLNS